MTDIRTSVQTILIQSLQLLFMPAVATGIFSARAAWSGIPDVRIADLLFFGFGMFVLILGIGFLFEDLFPNIFAHASRTLSTVAGVLALIAFVPAVLPYLIGAMGPGFPIPIAAMSVLLSAALLTRRYADWFRALICTAWLSIWLHLLWSPGLYEGPIISVWEFLIVIFLLWLVVRYTRKAIGAHEGPML